MFRNKKRIERLEEDFANFKKRKQEVIDNFEKEYCKIEESKRLLENKIEILEKNTKALFGEYVIAANNLVCPVCGDKVYVVIDDRYKQRKGLFYNPSIQDDGTFVYKIKCNNHCVGVRDESIFGAIERFKNLKAKKEV